MSWRYLRELDYTSIGLAELHPRVLRELADVTVRLLLIIFQKQ